MTLEVVKHFKNAFGKPILLFILEEDNELRITLKQGTIESCHTSNGFSSSLNGTTRSNGNCKQFYPDRRDHHLSSDESPTHPIESDPLFLSSPVSDNCFFKTIYTLLTTAIFTVSIFVALTTSSWSHTVNFLLSTLFTAISLMYIYYTIHKYIHELTEESLVVFKESPAFELSKQPKTIAEKPNLIDRDLGPGCFFHLKRRRLRAPEKQLLPLEKLRICETLKGFRIFYQLIVQSDCPNATSSRDCNKQDCYASGSDGMDRQSGIFDRSKKEPTRTVDLSHCTCKHKGTKRLCEFVIFEDCPPSLDCLEFIYARIKAFRQS